VFPLVQSDTAKEICSTRKGTVILFEDALKGNVFPVRVFLDKQGVFVLGMILKMRVEGIAQSWTDDV
jgi:hypothetical protein